MKIPTEQNEIKTMYDDAHFSWTAPARQEKGWLWFTIMGIILFVAVLYGLSTNAWTFSLALVVFAGVYVIYHFKHPKEIDVKISPVGIQIGPEKFPFSHVRYFWIHYQPPYLQSVNFRLANKWHPDLSVHLADQDPNYLREFLAEQVPEWEGKDEDLTETILRVLKF